ncbi:MAG TPA: GNAT family N-acetyltransferase [Rubrobacter sp.]|nr:GNAT family N-acetyltransferase [Rubrobacter sp.]
MADIRPATIREAEAVTACVREAYAKYVGRIGREPAPMLVDYEAAILAGEAWVLVEEDETSGVLVMRPEKDHLFVETVAVRADRQGSGLGRTLMEFAEEAARDRGLHEIRLYTNEKMEENLPFYRGLGFEETGRGLDDGYRRVFMKKRVRV